MQRNTSRLRCIAEHSSPTLLTKPTDEESCADAQICQQLAFSLADVVSLQEK